MSSIRDYISSKKYQRVFSRDKQVKYLLKISAIQLDKHDVYESSKTLMMITLPKKQSISQVSKIRINAFFTHLFLNELFTNTIMAWQSHEDQQKNIEQCISLLSKRCMRGDLLPLLYKYPFFHDYILEDVEDEKEALERCFSLLTKEQMRFDLFTHLRKLLAFRYNTLEDVFAEDGLHSCFIKASVAMDRSDIAEMFIHSSAIVDAQETYSAKKVKDVLMKFLISVRNAKTIYDHREYS
jgi:hypothetical protein